VEPNCSSATLVQIESQTQSKTYKPSRFNARTTEQDGVLLLYNSFTGRRCAIPSQARDHATTCLSQSTITGPLDQIGSYLFSKGFLVEEHVNEDARWDVRFGIHHYQQDRLELILLASEDCNFRCVYCSQQFKRGAMLPDVRQGVKALVKQRARKLQNFKVSWFGGEPLVGWEAIEELAPFFLENITENQVQYASDMTTNGYLLTPERSRKLIDWGVRSYQITLDGTGVDHDSHRPLMDGSPTFETIFENIRAMKGYTDEFFVSLRVNFDHNNVPQLQRLFAMAAKEFRGDARFSFDFHPIGKWGGPNDDQLNTCGRKDIAQLGSELRQQARAHGMNVQKLSSQLEPGGSNVCYAARPYNYIIGADGKVMKCTVVLDTEDSNVVGHIAADGTVTLRQEELLRWVQPYYPHDAMCQKCFFVPVCEGSSCPLPRVRSGTRPCPDTKLEIQQTLKTLWREEAALPEARKTILTDSPV
jgi:uncharacterized protein